MTDTSLVFNLVARDRASAVVGQMKEKITTAATGIAAGVAGALGAGIAESMNTGLITDKLAAQLGAGPEMAEEFGGIAGRLYTQGMGDSMEEAAGALKAVWQNGLLDEDAATADIESVTQKVMALGQTFDQDVGQVSVAVGQMIKTGMAANATEAMDILTRGFQQGANGADDLLDTMNEYGTQFRKFGIDGKLATGLLSQGLKAGARDADLVADSIKEFSIRAIDGSTATADGFKAVGLDATKMAADIAQGGPTASAALDLTLDKLRAMKDPIDQAAAATALFGTQSEDLGAALFALDPSSAVASLGDVAGATDRMSKTLSDSPAAALEKFKREAMAKLSEIGGQFVSFAMDNKQYFEPLAITLGTLAAAVLVVRGAMMAWAAAQAVMTGIQTAATAAQWLWNVALSANPIGLIILAIVALVAAVVMLWQHNETFRMIVMATWNAIWGFLQMVGGWITGTLWPWIKAAWDGIASGAMAMASWVKNAFNTVVDFVTGLPGRIASAAGGMWDGIKNAFKSAINWIIGKWNGLSFGIPNINIPGIGDVGGGTFRVPQIPYLAQGGHIARSGRVVVGDAGPEILDLPGGATVTPLSRAGAAGGEMTVRIEVAGPEEVTRLIRKIVRIDGRGSVQTAFGTG